jgi:hypothetical protein
MATFQLASWNENGKLIVIGYSVALSLQLIMLLMIAIYWRLLAVRFRPISFSSTFLILIGFMLCFYSLLTNNNLAFCDIFNKLSYSFFYSGFAIFDIYQLIKINAITKPGVYMRSLIYVLLMLRFLSYIHNIFSVKGAFVDNEQTGSHSCKANMTAFSVYQEHVISMIFEMTLMVQFFLYIRNNKKSGTPLTIFVKNIVKYETASFIIYFFLEISYIVTYSLFNKDGLTNLNSIYFNVPVLLFLYNSIIFVYLAQIEAESRVDSRSGGGSSIKSRPSFGEVQSKRSSFGGRSYRSRTSIGDELKDVGTIVAEVKALPKIVVLDTSKYLNDVEIATAAWINQN